jgi:DNA-binding transcriptional regulator/RsmH inhibitor MraZ
MLGFTLFDLAVTFVLGCTDITVPPDAAAETVAAAPAPAPVSASRDSILASHDFRDGKFGPFEPWNPSYVDVVNDPTGAGKGKVVRIHYHNASTEAVAHNHDAGFALETARIGLGQSIFFRGEFYLPPGIDRNPELQRKLLYFQRGVDALPEFWSVVSLWETGLTVSNGYVPPKGEAVDSTAYGLAKITPGRWHKLETELRLNSTLSAKDGIFRLWLDEKLVYENTKLTWNDPNWRIAPGDQKFRHFRVGEQVNVVGKIDEYRYWTNVTFATHRIQAPAASRPSRAPVPHRPLKSRVP